MQHMVLPGYVPVMPPYEARGGDGVDALQLADPLATLPLKDNSRFGVTRE